MITKSNITFGFMLANHPNRFGMYPVMLRITENRRTKRLKTELEVKKSDWNQNAKNYKHFRTSCSDYQVNNSRLGEILTNYKKVYTKLKNEGRASAENIIMKVSSGEEGVSFLQYAKERTQAIYDAGGIRNWKKYNGFCQKLEEYLKKNKKKDLLFTEVTPAFLSKYNSYLHKLPNQLHPEKLLHPNTIEVIFNIFKTIVNRAIKIDDKIKPEDNPFLKFEYHGVKTEKGKLDNEELEKIKALELPEGSLIWNCRNYFFFSFYCAGIRIGDFVQLRWCNITSEGRLKYQMGKNHKTRDLELVPQALEILKYYYKEDSKPSDYIFPLLSNDEVWASHISQDEKDTMKPELKRKMFNAIEAKTALINKELGKIQKKAGIETKISFHISRHTFAKMAKEKGLDNLEVKALLAHTNLSTTQKYMGDFDTSKNDKALKSVFVESTKEDEVNRIMKQLQGLNPEALGMILAKLNVKS